MFEQPLFLKCFQKRRWRSWQEKFCSSPNIELVSYKHNFTCKLPAVTSHQKFNKENLVFVHFENIYEIFLANHLYLLSELCNFWTKLAEFQQKLFCCCCFCCCWQWWSCCCFCIFFYLRNVPLKFGQNRVINRWNIAFIVVIS